MNGGDHSRRSKVASAIGGVTARTCVSCMRRRARWFCEADDAFLCHPCDDSIHSANPLARRHRRIRLKSSSPSILTYLHHSNSSPTWHRHVTRKARTPRPPKRPPATSEPPPHVPDTGDARLQDEGEEEELLYRVPILDPDVLVELYQPHDQEIQDSMNILCYNHQPHSSVAAAGDFLDAVNNVELAEFASGMDNLLGHDEFYIEGLGGLIMDSTKTEMEEERALYPLLSSRTQTMIKEENPQVEKSTSSGFLLKLDHEAVVNTWSTYGLSPWIDGERPFFMNSDMQGIMLSGGGADQLANYLYGSHGKVGGSGGAGIVMASAAMAVVVGGADVSGREARVTRYREKRRTRLFSKKIRYEVRKLNAEKRPRMKGRFVKRVSTNFQTCSSSSSPAPPSQPFHGFLHKR